MQRDEPLAKMERFSVKYRIWETLKIKIPQKLFGINAVIFKESLHCIGGENEKGYNTDYHFSIPLKRIFKKNGLKLIFDNWLRQSGFRGYRDVGRIVEEYAGNVW